MCFGIYLKAIEDINSTTKFCKMHGILKRKDLRVCKLHNALAPVLTPFTNILKCFVPILSPVGLNCCCYMYQRCLFSTHIIMTSSNENALLAFCQGNPPVTGWVNNRETGDLRLNHAHYDVTIILFSFSLSVPQHCLKQCHNDNNVTCQFV